MLRLVHHEPEQPVFQSHQQIQCLDSVQVLSEIMQDLGIGGFTVKLNHRRLLDAMMRVCGVPSNMFRATCSAIDKLDKEPWSVVETEMVETKGLPLEVGVLISCACCLSESAAVCSGTCQGSAPGCF